MTGLEIRQKISDLKSQIGFKGFQRPEHRYLVREVDALYDQLQEHLNAEKAVQSQQMPDTVTEKEIHNKIMAARKNPAYSNWRLPEHKQVHEEVDALYEELRAVRQPTPQRSVDTTPPAFKAGSQAIFGVNAK